MAVFWPQLVRFQYKAHCFQNPNVSFLGKHYFVCLIIRRESVWCPGFCAFWLAAEPLERLIESGAKTRTFGTEERATRETVGIPGK